MITKEREDYLKTIYDIQHRESPVRTNSIAHALGLEPASVTGAIKRLADMELLSYVPYKGVVLTPAGEKIALEVIRHHRLIELFLVERLGYGWDEVHEEAERLEHAVSERFIERISAALGYPESDPHGSPIPTKDGFVPDRPETCLAGMLAGQKGRVSRVDDDDSELLRYLADLGISPGVDIRVVELTPFGGPIHLLAGVAPLQIGPLAAEHVFVVIE